MSKVADMGRYDEIIAFGKVLHECGQVSDLDELFAYLEKPWRWQKEFNYWQAEGSTLEKEVLFSMREAWEMGEL